jgi:hypothetical protein
MATDIAEIAGTVCRRTYGYMLLAASALLAAQNAMETDDELSVAVNFSLASAMTEATVGHELICRVDLGVPLSVAMLANLRTDLGERIVHLAADPLQAGTLVRYGLHPEDPTPEDDSATSPLADLVALRTDLPDAAEGEV